MNKTFRLPGFTFNGMHCEVFNLFCESKEMGFPDKKKTIIRVPYSNHIVDLSGVYGGQTYDDRILKYTLHYESDSVYGRQGLYNQWTKIINWLSSPIGRVKIQDDVMPDYYYLGELITRPDFEELANWGTITLEFTCYPFRIYELQEGNDIWDTFDFEMDIAQKVDYTVSGTRHVSLYNIGVSTIMPTVITTAPITISDGSKQYPLTKGTHENVFNLPPGVTKLTLTGNAKVTFDWHKEMI